ncbi:MAG: 50S ribosomal protein L5, large subunit ribosomal protein L5 [Candidatus Bathyarchaeota archaeon B26-2]|nr:MAG: 50S ribosomal protein L5, large subunit ribosomal protein L5 [Candidatus Bathyarchaeota archaeon B26-2]
MSNVISPEKAEAIKKMWEENPMLRPKIEKVVVNVSVGKSGEPLEKASKILEELTGQRPCRRRAKKTIRDFGIRRGEPTACVVTLRGGRAEEFLKKAFQAVDSRIQSRSFDELGNFAFGIKEHIEIPGTRYKPELGIIGMDVCVSMEKPGYRVKKRRRVKSKIGSSHLLTREESILFVQERFGVEVV